MLRTLRAIAAAVGASDIPSDIEDLDAERINADLGLALRLEAEALEKIKNQGARKGPFAGLRIGNARD